ncbi:acyl-CoA dehydrogenase family protein [Gordonia aichiensis]|uniref:Putative acyl-CoA dehydrogenase n=1 Tax=Gordonia aichiensis NBRC 108223 TaxID=1220583 RepID=L7KGL4_9ACTN|nr:acyl-CoA dehydrogenase family protein [Gordonia aichiensis]GAC48000.1 putative acyl-CoA dehydrogenase [Gordonia aichiensis NBRC 108223]
MDFGMGSSGQAVADVADDVLSRHEPDWTSLFGGRTRAGETLEAATTSRAGFDDVLWRSLTDAGVLALPLPSTFDGDDLGVLDLLPLLRRLGSAAAVTPALGSLTSALFLQTVDPASRERHTATLTGGAWHAIAIGEPGDSLTSTPRTTVCQGTLSGTKSGVLHADGASTLLVACDAGVVAVDRNAAGVSLTRTPTSSGWGEFTVRFDDVHVDDDAVLSGDVSGLRDLHRLALSAYADGLVSGATRLTADHVSTRTQFGKPIALFQAVGQQLADIYVIGRSLNLATTAAAWRMSEGRDAQQDLGIAAYWAAAEIPAAMRTMTHLHGGVGVDLTYPLHRYFSIAKDLARLVGGAGARLDELADASAR